LRRQGFVDLQVNGYLGGLRLSGLVPRTSTGVTQALLDAGTLAYCATLITADLQIYERNLKLIARTASEPGVKGRLLGFIWKARTCPERWSARCAFGGENAAAGPGRIRPLPGLGRGTTSILTIAPEVEGRSN